MGKTHTHHGFEADESINMAGKILFNMPMKHFVHADVKNVLVEVELESIPAGALFQDFHVSNLIVALDQPPGLGDSVTVTVTNGIVEMVVTVSDSQKTGSTRNNGFDVDVSEQPFILKYVQSKNGNAERVTIIVVHHYIPI